MAARLLAVLAGALLACVLIAPRLWVAGIDSGKIELRQPAPSDQVGQADRELMALESLPLDSAPQLLTAIERWQALEASAPSEDHGVHARRRVAGLRGRLEALAARQVRSLPAKLAALRSARQYDQALAAIDDFVTRFPGTTVARRLEADRHAVLGLGAREQVSAYTSEFSGEPRYRGMQLAAMQQIEKSGYHALKFVRSGASTLRLIVELPRLERVMELEMILFSGRSGDLVYAPLRVRINGRVLFEEWGCSVLDPVDVRWPVRDYLRVGRNEIELSLHPMARTAAFVRRVGIYGYN